MLLRVLLVVGLLIDTVVVLFFAWDLALLWAILLVSLGILIGMCTIRGNAKIAGTVCVVGLVVVALVVVLRALPIHSLDRGQATHDRLTPGPRTGDSCGS